MSPQACVGCSLQAPPEAKSAQFGLTSLQHSVFRVLYVVCAAVNRNLIVRFRLIAQGKFGANKYAASRKHHSFTSLHAHSLSDWQREGAKFRA